MRRALAAGLALSLLASSALAQRIITPTGAVFGTLSGGTTTTPTVNGVPLDTHVFTTGGTLTVTGGNAYVEYFECGGGGGAGYSNSSFSGGLGGPGGVRAGIMKLTPGSYTIVIGAAGAAGAVSSNGSNGGDTTGLGLTATGGGGGGQFGVTGSNGLAGGNGGGGGAGTTTGSTGGAVSVATVPVQGLAGANGTVGQNVAAQGGATRVAGASVGVGVTDYRGVMSDITGSWVGYADGGSQLATTQGAQPGNTCRGGGAYNLSTGQAGDSGFFAVRALVTY